jgi:hypothetical protein
MMTRIQGPHAKRGNMATPMSYPGHRTVQFGTVSKKPIHDVKERQTDAAEKPGCARQPATPEEEAGMEQHGNR